MPVLDKIKKSPILVKLKENIRIGQIQTKNAYFCMVYASIRS